MEIKLLPPFRRVDDECFCEGCTERFELIRQSQESAKLVCERIRRNEILTSADLMVTCF